MNNICATSVADAVPFDPSVPSYVPIDNAVHFTWDTTTQTWKVDDLDVYHRQISVPDVTATTLNGTLTLIFNDNCSQIFTGTATGYTVVLASALTLQQGWKMELYNTTNETITIKDGSGTTLFMLAQNSVAYGFLRDATSVAGIWLWFQIIIASVASGIINYNIVSSTPFTTTSTTDVIITGLSVTPQAGTYVVFYNAESFQTTTPRFHFWTIYKNGAAVTDSSRTQDTAHSNQNMVDSTMSVISFNGSEACDVRVRAENGSLTINSRTLLLLRLGT